MTNAGGARTARAFAPSGVPLDLAATTVVLAAAFGVVVAFASNTTNTALAAWLGRHILATHALEKALGPETFTATGASLYQGWLGAVFTYLTSASPEIGPVLGVAFFFIALLLALARANERGASTTALVAIAALATFSGLGALSTPAVTVDWLLLSVTLLLVDRAQTYGVYGCALLTVLWCNVDAQGMLVPGILLLAAVGARVSDGSYSERTKLFVRAGVLALIATLLTPSFLELPLRAATYLHVDPALGKLREWQPAVIGAHARTSVIVPLILLAALFGTWRRERVFDAMLVVAGTVFVLMNATYAPQFVLAVAPVIVPSALRSLGGTSTRQATTLAVLLAFVAVTDVTLWGTAVARRSADPSLVSAPALLVPGLAADGQDHRIYCTVIDACDAFVASGNPHLRVFMDDREAAYPRSVIDDQIAIASVKPKWQSKLRAWSVDAIVLKRGQQLDEVLKLLPQTWREVANAGTAVLYVRGANP